ncbi:heme ABC transporter ATP-binding protein [Lysinibacillus sp. NPDC096418]|uniref:heme ABC transporter ATP-binding protein n=1 Tax=Lysinibacillus sp. NPDC096418 TaxID=3364138 RepID=UPI0038220A57
MVFVAQNLSFTVQKAKILKNVSMHIHEQEFVGLIGPNGSGKSTLLKNMYRMLKPQVGDVFLYNENIYKQSAKEMAKQLAVVGQETPVLFDFTVKDLVAMGRTPHKRLIEGDTKEDRDIIEQSMRQAGIVHLTERNFSSLSGGEKKRVIVARALAQQAKIMVLDEPTNHLDVQHQLQLMDLIRSLPITVVVALHDLNIAATYCDKIYVMQNGEIMAYGTPQDILTPAILKEVFGVHAEVSVHPITKKPHIFYIPEQFL